MPQIKDAAIKKYEVREKVIVKNGDVQYTCYGGVCTCPSFTYRNTCSHLTFMRLRKMLGRDYHVINGFKPNRRFPVLGLEWFEKNYAIARRWGVIDRFFLLQTKDDIVVVGSDRVCSFVFAKNLTTVSTVVEFLAQE